MCVTDGVLGHEISPVMRGRVAHSHSSPGDPVLTACRIAPNTMAHSARRATPWPAHTKRRQSTVRSSSSTVATDRIEECACTCESEAIVSPPSSADRRYKPRWYASHFRLRDAGDSTGRRQPWVINQVHGYPDSPWHLDNRARSVKSRIPDAAGVAVDVAGTAYVTDSSNDRGMWLPAGACAAVLDLE
jgi:hypothetical protein